MAGLKLMTQGGYVPRAAPHLLADNEAQRAINTKLYAGDLRSWKKPKTILPSFVLPANSKTVYRGRDSGDGSLWLSWASDVDVVKNPIQDSTNPMSIYYTGDGVPKKTNSDLAGTTQGASPAAYLNMGVAPPTVAPTVTRVGSGASPETRIYVYTNIQSFGAIEEESAPSPVSAEVLCGTGDTVTVDGFSAAPSGGYNVTKRRIYRSVTGSANTTFLFVTEIPVAATSFSDNVLAAGLGEELQSLTWEEPPADLRGIVAHPSGFLIGFREQEVCFSEVNAPHAWPSGYRLSLNSDLVGLGVYGTSVAVMTAGYPQVFTGLVPDSMSPEKLTDLEPCISKRSIVSDTNGVMYASPNGICVIGPSVMGLTTGNIMLKDDFAKFNPATLRSAVYSGKYFGFYEQGREFVEEGAFVLDRTLPATPLSLVSLSAEGCYVDQETGELYIISDDRVKSWEGDVGNYLPYEWLSKRFIFTKPANLGTLEIDGDFDNIEEAEELQERINEIIAENQALFASASSLLGAANDVTLNTHEVNGSILQNVPSLVDDRYLLVEVICDSQSIHIQSYGARGIYRLPSGYKGQAFEIRIAGNIECRYVKLAETVKELATL